MSQKVFQFVTEINKLYDKKLMIKCLAVGGEMAQINIARGQTYIKHLYNYVQIFWQMAKQ